MQFQISRRVFALAFRLRELRHLHTAATERIFHANAFLVRAHAIRFDRGSTREGGRSKQAAAKARSFFIRPVDQANGDRGPPAIILIDPAQDSQSGEHSERAVEPATVGHGIEMAADDERARRLAGHGEPAVSRGIFVMLHGQAAPLGLEPVSCF